VNSPYVAAAAAMLISHGITTPQEIFERLTSTSVDLGEIGFDSKSGHGLLQVHSALLGEVTVLPEPPAEGGDDVDGDSWSVENGDCDDHNANIYPGHNDSKGRWGRDGVDNDCNGIIDG